MQPGSEGKLSRFTRRLELFLYLQYPRNFRANSPGYWYSGTASQLHHIAGYDAAVLDLNLVHYNEKLYCSVPKTAQNFNVLNYNLMFLTFQQVSKFCQFFSIFLSIFQLPLRRSTPY